MGVKAQVIDFLLAGYRTPDTDVPLASGYVYTYLAGTVTLATTWTDRDKTTAATNPIVLDSAGKAEIYGDNIYTFVIKDAGGSTIETIEYAQYQMVGGNEVNFLADLKSSSGSANDAIRVHGRTAIGDGYEGWFQWDTSDLSAKVTLDTLSGMYAAPNSDPTGASGAWKRVGSDYGATLQASWFGAIGNGSTDCGAPANAAVAMLPNTGGKIKFPPGQCNITTSIVAKSNVHFYGEGKTQQDALACYGTELTSSTTDLFVNTASVQNAKFSDFGLVSASGGGHIFNFSTTNTIISMSEWYDVSLNQKNTDKSILLTSSTGTNPAFLGNWFHHFYFNYMGNNSVPAFNIKSKTINQLAFESFRSTATNGNATAGTYAINIEGTTVAIPVQNCNITQATVEIPGGGFLQLKGVVSTTLDTIGIWDLTATPNNPMFNIVANDAGEVSKRINLVNIGSRVGTALKPDVYFNGAVSGQTAVNIEHCWLNYLDGGSANGAPFVIFSSVINNIQNTSYINIGSGTITLGGDGASTALYSIIGGRPGAYDGYLRVTRDGTYSFGVNTGNAFTVGGTETSPKIYLYNSGNIKLLGCLAFGASMAAASAVNNSLFLDSADNIIKIKDNSGVVHTLY